MLGRTEHWDAASGTYCSHCAGAEVVLLDFGGRDNLHLRVPCYRFSFHLSETASVWFTRGDVRGYQEALYANKGTIDVLECRRDFVRLRFSADFGEHGSVEGSAEVPLKYEAGYD
jgi:hypothetical protein